MTQSTATNVSKSREETEQVLLRLMWSDVGCNGGTLALHENVWFILAWFEDRAKMNAFPSEFEGVRLEKEFVGRIEAQ